MHMLRLYSTEDLEACPLDKWGILDPGETRRDPGREGEKRQDGEPLPGHASYVLTPVMDADAAPLDVILVPGVAFDKDCNRVSFREDLCAVANASSDEGRRSTTPSSPRTPTARGRS